MKCPQHYLTEIHEVILFYNGLGIPTQQILDSRGAIPSKTTADAKVAIQEMAEYSQKWHNGTSRSRSTETFDGLAAIKPTHNLGERSEVIMDDLNITMEEYIRLEEEKSHRRGKVYSWETTTYDKILYNEDVHNLRSVETEFLAIVFDNAFTSEVTLSYEPTVSSLNNEINFRISFDESDDEDYTVIYDKNSFSYKIIYVNNLKTDSENDNDKINMHSFPSSKPMVSYFNDLDFFKDFENEFPAIIYNDALTSKLDFLTEPTVSPQDINEFNLRDETSLSECDEEEQNILYFNDLFPFHVIYPDDLKSDKDNDDDKIDIKHSSRGNVINTDDGAYAQRNMKKTDSDILYAISIKEDTTYLCQHFAEDHEGTRSNMPYPENSIRRLQDIEGEYSGRYQTLSLLQEIPNSYSHRAPIRRID
ncbi:hypothetical protein Tco_1111413 [Tanacetum coccineum]|uniref:Uncharacterized protein n=1 Tax=Tanacetum coccineum TaxID=301880 RepID=A0ABQ5IN12_9ASTR